MGFRHVLKFKQQKTPLKLIRGVKSIKKGNSNELSQIVWVMLLAIVIFSVGNVQPLYAF